MIAVVSLAAFLKTSRRPMFALNKQLLSNYRITYRMYMSCLHMNQLERYLRIFLWHHGGHQPAAFCDTVMPKVDHTLLARLLPHIEAVAAQPRPAHVFNPGKTWPGAGWCRLLRVLASLAPASLSVSQTVIRYKARVYLGCSHPRPKGVMSRPILRGTTAAFKLKKKEHGLAAQACVLPLHHNMNPCKKGWTGGAGWTFSRPSSTWRRWKSTMSTARSRQPVNETKSSSG